MCQMHNKDRVDWICMENWFSVPSTIRKMVYWVNEFLISVLKISDSFSIEIQHTGGNFLLSNELK